MRGRIISFLSIYKIKMYKNMKYGKFTDSGKEFIIEDVDTPTPWINYLYNKEYFATISNNGGGISYHKNPLHGRVTRYRINDVPSDRPGKYIYVKDEERDKLWSLTWQPIGKEKDSFKMIHGFGYSRSVSEIEEIESSVTFFVPRHDNQEIWFCKLKNKSDVKRKLQITGYVEFAPGHALVDVINQCDDQHFNRLNFDEQLNSLFATKTYWVTNSNGTQQQENQEWDQWAFFTCNLPIKNFETRRENFIGKYRNESNPAALETGKFSNENSDYGNSIGALQVEAELEPGEVKFVVFSLGVIEKEKFEQQKIERVKKYQNTVKAEIELLHLKRSWTDYLDCVSIDTPDEDVNIYINYWTKYQAKVAFDVGRVASYYYWGISRGFGFRDTNQDTIAVTISSPDTARERLIMLADKIFSDGRAYHHFYRDGHGELTQHCDDPLWYILTVTDYIKESGDYQILEKVENFADGEKGTILEHLFAVVNFAGNRLGKHGLPIFGRGDWNDTLDYIGGNDGGESVWGAMFYAAMLDELVNLLIHSGKTEKLEMVTSLRNRLRSSVLDNCWDGKWFIRAFGENDRKLGSSQNEFGKIFINPQSWAVIGKVAGDKILRTALDSAKKELDTPIGPKLVAPAFPEIDKNIGLVTRCVAGKKENGAVFCHPVTWLIQAECMMKNGNRAFEYYKKLLPNKIDPDTFCAEPYVYSQYITSNEHPSEGKASHSWQTGTAAWMYRVFIDYITGVRSSYNGLTIDPVIPSDWKKFSVTRRFRGTNYRINVFNPDGVESGIIKIEVDGEIIEGSTIPVVNKEECFVSVIMGRKKQNK